MRVPQKMAEKWSSQSLYFSITLLQIADAVTHCRNDTVFDAMLDLLSGEQLLRTF